MPQNSETPLEAVAHRMGLRTTRNFKLCMEIKAFYNVTSIFPYLAIFNLTTFFSTYPNRAILNFLSHNEAYNAN